LSSTNSHHITHFVHDSAPHLEAPAHIVLSPRYYWTASSQIALRSMAQARKIAPSLFEHKLPQGNYTYEIQKKGDTVHFIAYDKEAILAQLLALGMKLEKIKSLILAQFAFAHIESAITIDEKHLLVPIDGMVTLIDARYVDAPAMPMEQALASVPHKLPSISVGHMWGIDMVALRRPLITFGALSSAALVLLGIDLSHQHTSLQESINALRTTYALPATQLQQQSIQARLERIQKEQSFLRDTLNRITKERSRFEGKLLSIDATPALITLTLQNPAPDVAGLFAKASIQTAGETTLIEVRP